MSDVMHGLYIHEKIKQIIVKSHLSSKSILPFVIFIFVKWTEGHLKIKDPF